MNLQFAIDTQDRDEINQGKFGGHCSSLRQVNKADWRLNCAFVIPVGAGFGQISFQSTFLEAEYQKALNTSSFYQEHTYFCQTDGFEQFRRNLNLISCRILDYYLGADGFQ